MTTEQRKFIDVFKRQLIIGAVGYILLIAVSMVGFYYKTNSDIAQIKKEQVRQNKVLERKASKEDLKNIDSNLKNDIGDIKANVKMLLELRLNEKK